MNLYLLLKFLMTLFKLSDVLLVSRVAVFFHFYFFLTDFF